MTGDADQPLDHLPTWIVDAILQSLRPDKPLAFPARRASGRPPITVDETAPRRRPWPPPPVERGYWVVSDEWLTFAGRFLIPRRFGFVMYPGAPTPNVRGGKVYISEAAKNVAYAVVEVEVGDTGQLRCVRLDVIAPNDESSIDGAMLRRIALGRAMRRFATQITIDKQHEERPIGEQMGDALEEVGKNEAGQWNEVGAATMMEISERLHAAEAAREQDSQKAPDQAFPATTANLRRVADAYRAAMAQGKNPRKYVAETLHIGESTASRRIRAARDHDPPLLGEALGKKAGEAPLPKEQP
jgi:hypothetical protein